MKKILAGLGLLAVASWSAPASATIMTFNDLASYNAAVAGLTSVNEDFSVSQTQAASITFASMVTSTQGGNSAGLTDPDCNVVHTTSNGPHFHGRVDGGAPPSSCSNRLDWAFPMAITGVGFEVTGLNNTTIQVTDADETVIASTSGFIGFVSTSSITALSFVEGSNSSDGFNVRNLTFAKTPMNAPEPGALALIGFSLAGLGIVRRRRKTA